MKSYGGFAIHDSGNPNNGLDYVTLVILHGFAWHSAIFLRFLPLAQKYNARIILVNRRDYPNSEPVDDEALYKVSGADDSSPGTLEVLKEYMKRRARELHDFLCILVEAENIPRSGGLVIAGWSFGASWITALLANAPEFPTRGVHLAAYVRRTILYDPPYHTLGYPPPAESYNPLSDPSLPPGEGAKIFPLWVSGYYSHGDSPSELEHRVALTEPSPTIATMSVEQIESALHAPPASPGGSDAVLMETGIRCGLFASLRDEALFSTSSTDGQKPDWDTVPVRYIWCDRSPWEMPWGTWALRSYLDHAKLAGKHTREIEVVRLDGLNHFAHWDQPDRTLKAFLATNV